MTVVQERCVAIIRRVEHLDQACVILNKRNTHFLCMSLETLVFCRQHGFSASTPENYDQVRGNFTVKGQQLARSWINKVIGDFLCLSNEQQTYLTTHFTFFFAMALFALDLIKAVTEQHRPHKVYLWRDPKRPILGDWGPGSGEGAVFAQVAEAWLTGQGIPVDFFDLTEERATSRKSKHSLVDRLRCCKSHIPRPIRSCLQRLRFLGRYGVQRFTLRTQVAMLQWKRYLFKHPIILFWGVGPEAVYQAELALQWERERGWYALRVERIWKGSLQYRSRIRNGNVPLGIDATLMRLTFGSSVTKVELRDSIEDKLLLQTSEWWLTACPDGSCIGANLALVDQHLAMIKFAASLRNAVQSLSKLARNLRPDCIVTHSDGLVDLAAHEVAIPSVAISHGGIVSPYGRSMHGDVNVVSGDIQKEFYEEVQHYSGRLLALGVPQIELPRSKSASVGLPTSGGSSSSVPTITFLANTIDFYYWALMDFDMYVETCQKLGEMAHAHRFRLIVKLHPRYGEISVYEQLFESDGLHVRLETTPLLGRVLEETDLVLFSTLSTAIMEVAAYQVPAIMFLYHFRLDELVNPYYRELCAAFTVAQSVQEVEELVLQLLDSSEARRELIRRQNHILPKMLKSCGETASRLTADICQQLMK